MKKISYISLIVSLLSSVAYNQDYIITYNYAFEEIDCKIINIDRSGIYYQDHTGMLVKIQKDKVQKCVFNNGNDKIIMQKPVLDTLITKIYQVTEQEIFFKHLDDPNNTRHSIKREKILSMQFGTLTENNNSLQSIMIQLGKLNRTSSKTDQINIISGNNVNGYITRLDNDKVYIEIEREDEPLESFIEINKLESIQFINNKNYRIYDYDKFDDVIITTSGKEIKCKIENINENSVSISIDNEYNTVSSYQNKDKILECRFNTNPTFKRIAEVKENGMVVDFNSFVFGISGGWSYILSKISDDIPGDFEDFYKDLKSGTAVGIGLDIYRGQTGGGVNYNLFLSSNSLNNVTITTPTGFDTGKYSEDLSIHTICPVLSYRSKVPNGTTYFNMKFGVGPMIYNNKIELISEKYDITGVTLGLNSSIGFDFMFSDNFGIGLKLDGYLGSYNKFKVEGEEFELDEPENVSRIDITIGLRLCD